jgi:hypothetical protein
VHGTPTAGEASCPCSSTQIALAGHAGSEEGELREGEPTELVADSPEPVAGAGVPRSRIASRWRGGPPPNCGILHSHINDMALGLRLQPTMPPTFRRSVSGHASDLNL